MKTSFTIRETLIRLSFFWAVCMASAALHRWAVDFDKLHPAPSQAAADEVYRQNNEDRMMAARAVLEFSAGMSQALAEQIGNTNAAPAQPEGGK